MKALFTFFALQIIFSNVSLACPDLRGVYLCKQNSYHTDTFYTFDQQETAGFWTFQMTASKPDRTPLAKFEFQTDDIERPVTDSVTGFTLWMKSKCTANELQVVGTSKTTTGDVVRFSEVLALTTNGDLSNTSLDKDGATVHETCERQ